MTKTLCQGREEEKVIFFGGTGGEVVRGLSPWGKASLKKGKGGCNCN